MTWTLHLPVDLPSANRHGGASTNARHAANAAMYRRQRDGYVSALMAAMRAAGVPNMNAWRDVADIGGAKVRRVTIVRLWGKGCRAWDDDNMVAACKGLRDAMQCSRTGRARTIPGAGLVWDDSAKWSRWEYRQEKAADGRPGVRIEISDEGPAPSKTPILDMAVAAVTDRPDVLAVLSGGKRRRRR
jgi:hypothetical protein